MVTDAVFSQWAPTPFYDEDGTVYPTAEHYMMVAKARLFDAEDIAKDILSSGSPGRAKALGRQVEPFNQKTWEAHREQIVLKANSFKFSQNAAAGQYLLQTGSKLLVEASPVDQIWGIGLPKDHTAAKRPWDWRGFNLLGFALMQVRDELRGQKNA